MHQSQTLSKWEASRGAVYWLWVGPDSRQLQQSRKEGEVRKIGRNHREIKRRLSPELHISQIPFTVSILKLFAGLAPAVFLSAVMSCKFLRKRSEGDRVLAGQEK